MQKMTRAAVSWRYGRTTTMPWLFVIVTHGICVSTVKGIFLTCYMPRWLVLAWYCTLSPFASLYDNDCANCFCPTFCDVCWIISPYRLFNFCTCLYGFKVLAHPRVCADCSCAPLCDDGPLTMPWLIYLLLKCRRIVCWTVSTFAHIFIAW
jgi:hypothetical protein